ncbi:MAG: hypothetical protein EA397_03995 [Deltaproteobacteria bacterium]|nr:MAG: hypothetical protein EA397_03995 [Deltaproteobacteria bacterium]
MRPLLALAVALLLGGCSKAIDNFMVHKPIKQAMLIPDLPMVCQSASANVSMAAGAHIRKPPRRALAILETTAAACSEREAMAHQIDAERAWATLDGPQRVAEVTDARERERRARATTAGRLNRAYGHVEARFGTIGESCPKMRNEEDELTYLLGLIAGAGALLQDQASGGSQGVTTDRLQHVARGAACLDDHRWWHVPSALRAGTWASVPGTAPEGVDPWDALDRAAASGEEQGMLVARAIQAQLAANAGRTEIVERALTKAYASSEPAVAEYLMLDVNARAILQHQLDLLWVKARGHRSVEPGKLPGRPGLSSAPTNDPFGEDPFGEDPFASGDDSAPGPDDADPPDPENNP